ncbi:VagD (plasmid) [Salmonella enterica subsp. enterica serovar Dublin str. CT_02021853]|uniref:VagD n=2 Tax=Salmonella dublin TaxID=98360 RepID=A0A8X6JW86_SALDU|nr:VagD [Salmonella enterica subsp. enterica serovar Dublin str. CT_02021853]EGE27971.1 VagD [Salmonella enterica subsp. enterica serovar Dublin str. SD3246]
MPPQLLCLGGAESSACQQSVQRVADVSLIPGGRERKRLRTFCFTALTYPVFQYQARYPLKFPRIIRHQHGTGGDGMPGNRRVVRTDRRPGEAQCHLNLRGGVYRSAIPGQDGIEAGAERVDQLDETRRGLRSGGAEAHLGVGDGRDHDTVAAQHRLLKALQHRFRLLAHDERTDTGIEHIGLRTWLFHSSKRPSSLTTSSRSAIKSGSAFSSCANEPQVGRTGRRMMLSPSRTISSSLTPSKSRSRGRRMARLLPFLKMDTVLMILSRVSVDM